ncbi:hypothetical protein AN216_15740 [Streptomyces oceani]|uniref:Type II toxin-antitoxin system PemK/MazF family toxin n=1 Tax=Streptomyces oceani TaxID=1075402 RepID=A0A1E7KG89_9ACTN|nr:hypothetical protein AN216_15740 [Streptomyces oceani]
MDTWWWIALGAVMLLALTATLVDGAGRLARRRDRGDGRVRAARTVRRPPGEAEGAGQAEGAAPPRTGEVPCPGEIWTGVLPTGSAPAADSPAAGAAPAARGDGACLVLAVGADAVRAVVVLTPGGGAALDTSAKPDGVAELAGLDGLARAERLASDTVLTVPWADLRQRVGVVDPALWDRVRYLAG